MTAEEEEIAQLRSELAALRSTSDTKLKMLIRNFREQLVHGVDCPDGHGCPLIERHHRHQSNEERIAIRQLLEAAGWPKKDERTS